MFKGPVRTSNNNYVGFRSSEREMEDSSATLSSLILFQRDTEESDLQYHHILEEFGSVFEATSSFNDQDQCIDFIRSCSQNDYIVLIYVGTLARLTRSGFIDLANLHSIYVYDSVSNIHQRSLVSPSPKIRGTASTIDALCRKLLDDLMQEKSDQESMRKITELIQVYRDYQAALQPCAERVRNSKRQI